MPNLLLTNICNRNCPYCFALAQIEAGTTQANWEMSFDELETILGYLDPAKDVVSLLGGEPTLHSRFEDVVRRVCDAGFTVKIFTNGVTTGLRAIHGINSDDVRIILNLNMPDTYNEQEWQQIEKNCKLFGDQIALSFNVFRPDFSWEYIKEAIAGWGLNPFVRIGMAQPIKGIANTYLLEEDLKQASSRLVEMAEDMAESGIKLGFDCGFRTCSFTKEELGTLVQCGTHPIFVCNPVLDIGPNLMTWRCFPFSMEQGVRLTDFGSLKEVENHFNEKWKEQKQQGNIDDCADCRNIKIGSCGGGCLSRTVRRLSTDKGEVGQS